MQDPTAPFRIVLTDDRCRDPALDMSPAEIAEYRRTRDEALLKFHAGAVPSWFYVQRLGKPTVAQLVDAIEYGGEPRRCIVAFLLACTRVEPAPLEGDGAAAPDTLAPADLRDVPGGVKMAEDAWYLDIANEFHMAAVYEVGEVARQFAAMGRRAKSFFFSRVG